MDIGWLLLLLAGRSVPNDESCEGMAKALNASHDRRGYTHFEVDSGQFVDYSFDGLTVLGLNTFRRTGPCTIEELDPGLLELGEALLYTYRLGLSFLQLYFKRITSPEGESFSGSLEVVNSSLRYRNVVCTPQCEDKGLWDLALEEASPLFGRTQITLYSANDKYDNKIIDTPWFVNNFNRILSEQRLIAYAVKNRFFNN